MGLAQPGIETLDTADRLWHLRQAPLLEGLSLVDLTAVAHVGFERLYHKGAVIFHRGDPADSLFILNRGCVRVSLFQADGREKILEILKKGDVFEKERRAELPG